MKTLLAIDMDDYVGRHMGRSQHLMNQLSKHYRVVYVDKMNSLPHAIRDYGFNFKKYLKLNFVEINSNLTFVKLPHIFLPFANSFRWINRINCLILRIFMRIIYKRCEVTEVDIAWFGHPYAGDMKLSSKIKVYDCMDEHSGFKGIFNANAVKWIEHEILRKSDLSIFSADYLSENKKDYTKESVVIKNAADYDHFYVEATESVKHDNSILYSGVISDWVEIELLEYLAINLPSYTFRFVGPVRKNWLAPLEPYSNVEIVGEVPYSALPKYYNAAAVCIIPFDPSWELIKSTNPIKLYEYLAAGKPTVSTRFDEVEKCEDLVSIANSHESFRDKLIEAIESNSLEKIEQRQKFARDHSWQSRADELLPVLERLSK